MLSSDNTTVTATLFKLISGQIQLNKKDEKETKEKKDEKNNTNADLLLLAVNKILNFSSAAVEPYMLYARINSTATISTNELGTNSPLALQLKGKFNLKDTNGSPKFSLDLTSLAAALGNIKVLEALNNHGIPNSISKTSNTLDPFLAACLFGRLHAIQYLISNHSVSTIDYGIKLTEDYNNYNNDKTLEDLTPIKAAILSGNPEVLEELMLFNTVQKVVFNDAEYYLTLRNRTLCTELEKKGAIIPQAVTTSLIQAQNAWHEAMTLSQRNNHTDALLKFVEAFKMNVHFTMRCLAREINEVTQNNREEEPAAPTIAAGESKTKPLSIDEEKLKSPNLKASSTNPKIFLRCFIEQAHLLLVPTHSKTDKKEKSDRKDVRTEEVLGILEQQIVLRLTPKHYRIADNINSSMFTSEKDQKNFIRRMVKGLPFVEVEKSFNLKSQDLKPIPSTSTSPLALTTTPTSPLSALFIANTTNTKTPTTTTTSTSNTIPTPSTKTPPPLTLNSTNPNPIPPSFNPS